MAISPKEGKQSLQIRRHEQAPKRLPLTSKQHGDLQKSMQHKAGDQTSTFTEPAWEALVQLTHNDYNAHISSVHFTTLHKFSLKPRFSVRSISTKLQKLASCPIPQPNTESTGRSLRAKTRFHSRQACRLGGKRRIWITGVSENLQARRILAILRTLKKLGALWVKMMFKILMEGGHAGSLPLPIALLYRP